MSHVPLNDGSDPHTADAATGGDGGSATRRARGDSRTAEAEIRLQRRGRTAPTPPVGSATRSHTPDAHLRHASQHLERLASGLTAVAEPEKVFLGGLDGELFLELIGFRLVGHPSLIFGAVRFRRHDFPGIRLGREPLGSFLAGPGSGRPGLDSTAVPGTVPVLLPRDHEAIPSFLNGLRAGRAVAPVYVETARIVVAFDLRLSSPASLPALQRRAGPLRRHLFRTDRGHVIAGLSHGLAGGPYQRGPFVVVRDASQITPRGRIALPNLVLNRSCLTLAAEVDSRDRDMAAARWVPFSAATASPAHLLLN